jgi:hypothetical protein
VSSFDAGKLKDGGYVRGCRMCRCGIKPGWEPRVKGCSLRDEEVDEAVSKKKDRTWS